MEYSGGVHVSGPIKWFYKIHNFGYLTVKFAEVYENQRPQRIEIYINKTIVKTFKFDSDQLNVYGFRIQRTRVRNEAEQFLNGLLAAMDFLSETERREKFLSNV